MSEDIRAPDRRCTTNGRNGIETRPFLTASKQHKQWQIGVAISFKRLMARSNTNGNNTEVPNRAVCEAEPHLLQPRPGNTFLLHPYLSSRLQGIASTPSGGSKAIRFDFLGSPKATETVLRIQQLIEGVFDWFGNLGEGVLGERKGRHK